jgi:Ca2+-binding EF-hand superfamily protein
LANGEYLKDSIVNRRELQDWFKAFHQDVPSGLLKKSDFNRTYKHYFPFGESKKLSDHVFHLFDLNQDGLVDFTDFVRVLSLLSRGETKDKMDCVFLHCPRYCKFIRKLDQTKSLHRFKKGIFNMYDFDEDGFIGRAELLTLVDCMYRTVGDVSSSFPEDQETPEDRVNYLMERMDLDGDGKLSRQEFELGCLQDASILDGIHLYTGWV